MTTSRWVVVCRTKKADEAEVDVDTACVPKIQPHSQKEVTSSGSEASRQEVLDAKRARLRQLLERETIELENSLRDLGYAFIPTQPWPFSLHFFRSPVYDLEFNGSVLNDCTFTAFDLNRIWRRLSQRVAPGSSNIHDKLQISPGVRIHRGDIEFIFNLNKQPLAYEKKAKSRWKVISILTT